MYTIAYKKEIEERIKNVIQLNKENETVILAMATINGTEIVIDNILSTLGDGQTDVLAYIEPEKQLKLMKYCGIKKEISVIIHTHLYAKEQVAFSPIDMKFIKAFQTVQEKLKCEQSSLFLVYGAGKTATALMIDGKEERGNIITTINYRGVYYEKVYSKI